ncbi:LOW QUALITY PROTEIN: hypothetical protein HID58_088003 [Brassica napus]|uniref:Uncharacterized protein n=1 Tax=Brassica napus TaxID=3708 RepID=A0ABQ7XUW2_BRANA|nr:LOW QUALITY PROTEIN: hypothetical protein HID58_088003 [Brassica napus]
MNITTSTTPRIFISVPACRFEPQPSPTVCLDSGCTYQDVFSEASVYMLSCFDVTSAVLIAQVPPRHKRNALLLRVLLQLLANLCFNEELSCDHFTRTLRSFRVRKILFNKISGPVLILGSRYLKMISNKLLACFLYNIEIRPPLDKSQLLSWNNRLEDDMKIVQSDTIDRIKECVKEKEGVPPVKQRSLELFLTRQQNTTTLREALFCILSSE